MVSIGVGRGGVAINPSHARQEREERAERHRVRQLLKTSAGARQWVREAQRELDNWLAGLPAWAVVCARLEVNVPGSEIQRLVQEAIDQRVTPSVLASRVYNLVADRMRAEQAKRPPCAACGHHAVAHSTGMAAWCYECKRECCYAEPADAWAWEADAERCIHDPSCSCESGAHCPRRPLARDVPDYAQW